MDQLEQPLRYIPLNNKAFEFNAGLRRLQPENSHKDRGQRLIQIDRFWPHYRAEKIRARQEQLDKYVCSRDLSSAASSRVTAFLLGYLSQTWPQQFKLVNDGQTARLDCLLSGEILYFDQALKLTQVTTTSPGVEPAYINALDALGCQIQEDLAICEYRQNNNYISWLHLCLPNHWAATDKVGQDFISAHAPVPGMDRINRQSEALIETLVRKGPFERFTWGLATDTRLNHHPQAPAQNVADQHTQDWHGRCFNSNDPQLYLRVERQVTVGLPDVRAFIFLIRTYLYDITSLDRQQLQQLSNSLTTMSPDIQAYKGLSDNATDIMHWLNELALQP